MSSFWQKKALLATRLAYGKAKGLKSRKSVSIIIPGYKRWSWYLQTKETTTRKAYSAAKSRYCNSMMIKRSITTLKPRLAPTRIPSVSCLPRRVKSARPNIWTLGKAMNPVLGKSGHSVLNGRPVEMCRYGRGPIGAFE